MKVMTIMTDTDITTGSFSIAIISFGEERANLSAFRTLVPFALVWFISSSSWCLGRAAACDCGTSYLDFYVFFYS